MEGMRRVKREVRAFCTNGLEILEHRVRVAKGEDTHRKPTVQRRKLVMGTGDGRWVICPDRLGADSVVYSVGVGRDISFDLAMIRRFGCRVDAFDPTPLAQEWLKTQVVPPSFAVHPWGLAAHDGTATFSLPEHHAVSFTMTDGKDAKQVAECAVYRLPTMLEMLQHDRVDLLKMDIEGAEYDVMDDLLANASRIDQLVIEFHHRWKGNSSPTEQAIDRIEACGLKLFHVSARGLEYSFVR